MLHKDKNTLPVGVFLIGLAFLTVFHCWWPGILFVIAVYLLTKGLVAQDIKSRLLPAVIIAMIGVSAYIDIEKLREEYVWGGVFFALGLFYVISALRSSK